MFFIWKIPTCCIYNIEIALMSHIAKVLMLWNAYMYLATLIICASFCEWDLLEYKKTYYDIFDIILEYLKLINF
jgi:hypothetical protein